MDLSSLMSELRLRGLDQEKSDAALRCLVHVYSVQDYASPETGGVLTEDILNSYQLEVAQAASSLFLETIKSHGREAFRVKWGFDDTAANMQAELWEHASQRWEQYVSQLNERYLGFILPQNEDGARVTANWKLSKELKWFSIELPQHGWSVLRMVDDLGVVALKLDIAFEYRQFGPEGIRGTRVLLHENAYESLKAKRESPPEDLAKLIRLWKFFSEYDVEATDFVALMEDCGLTLDDVLGQIQKFFSMNLTSQYREGQYPPYFINDKKQKEYQTAVRDLLRPMDEWLSRKEVITESTGITTVAPAEGIAAFRAPIPPV